MLRFALPKRSFSGPEEVYSETDEFDKRCVVDTPLFAWNMNTRQVCRTIWNTFVSSRELKFDLSGDALLLTLQGKEQRTTSTLSPKLNSLQTQSSLLQQLLKDSKTKFVATSSNDESGNHGLALQSSDEEEDVMTNEILFEFRKPQVMNES